MLHQTLPAGAAALGRAQILIITGADQLRAALLHHGWSQHDAEAVHSILFEALGRAQAMIGADCEYRGLQRRRAA